MDRVRGFVRLYSPQMCLAAGEIVADGTPAAPYFEFLVLTGRPLEQRQTLRAAFTNLIVEHLGSPRAIPKRCVRAVVGEYASARAVASTVRLDVRFQGVFLFFGSRCMEPAGIPGRLRHCEPGAGCRVSQIFGPPTSVPFEGRITPEGGS